jgi:hypothetical protein
VAALHDAASLLPVHVDGAQVLYQLARDVPKRRYTIEDMIAVIDYHAMMGGRTPDERAAFALAREALSTLDADAKETP